MPAAILKYTESKGSLVRCDHDRRFTNPVWLVWLCSLPCGKTLLLSGFFRNARICQTEQKRTNANENCQKLSEKNAAYWQRAQ
jgi:hypothetical protein